MRIDLSLERIELALQVFFLELLGLVVRSPPLPVEVASLVNGGYRHGKEKRGQYVHPVPPHRNRVTPKTGNVVGVRGSNANQDRCSNEPGYLCQDSGRRLAEPGEMPTRPDDADAGYFPQHDALRQTQCQRQPATDVVGVVAGLVKYEVADNSYQWNTHQP